MNIRFPDKTQEWLFTESSRTGMSVSSLVRVAVESMRDTCSETHGGVKHEQTAVSRNSW